MNMTNKIIGLVKARNELSKHLVQALFAQGKAAANYSHAVSQHDQNPEAIKMISDTFKAQHGVVVKLQTMMDSLTADIETMKRPMS